MHANSSLTPSTSHSPHEFFSYIRLFIFCFETYTPAPLIANKHHEKEEEEKNQPPFRSCEDYTRLAKIMQETLVFCAPHTSGPKVLL